MRTATGAGGGGGSDWACHRSRANYPADLSDPARFDRFYPREGAQFSGGDAEARFKRGRAPRTGRPPWDIDLDNWLKRLGLDSFDALKTLFGIDLADILSSMMIAPKTQRAVLGGVVDVYPLAIPAGEGITVPIQLIGGFGFRNLNGVLILQVPPAAVDLVRAQLAHELAVG